MKQLKSREDWEATLSSFLQDAINNPDKEAVVCERLIEFVKDLCEDDYAKGYTTGFHKGFSKGFGDSNENY